MRKGVFSYCGSGPRLKSRGSKYKSLPCAQAFFVVCQFFTKILIF